MQIYLDWLTPAVFETIGFTYFINFSTGFVNSRQPGVCGVQRLKFGIYGK